MLLLQVLRDGVLYRYVRDPEGTALTSGDGSRWSPAEGPSLLHWGVAADGETDDAGPITRFVTYLDRVGREGYVPMGTYAVSHVVCRELRRSLVLRCNADAHFLGLQTYEVLPELSGRSHDITAFPVSQRGVQVAVWNGERMVSLQSGRDYDLAGNRITWRPCSDTLAAVQEPVRIVSGTLMISLGSAAAVQRPLHLAGRCGGQFPTWFRAGPGQRIRSRAILFRKLSCVRGPVSGRGGVRGGTARRGLRHGADDRTLLGGRRSTTTST